MSSMGFVCPECLRPGSLRVRHRLHVGPDNMYDAIALQTVSCDACAFKGVAVYGESRRGDPADVIVEHNGYRINAREHAAISALIEACPRPGDARCACKAHRALGGSLGGRWNGLAAYNIRAKFPMRPAHASAERRRMIQPVEQSGVPWRRTTDPAFPYEAVVDGRRWALRRDTSGANPQPSFTLLIDGVEIAQLHSWPEF